VDIADRYGRGTYALITGGAGGIGKEFALDLASKGFNLILADCNEANLEATKQEILQKNTDTLIKTLILDFSKATDPEFYEHFSEEVKIFNYVDSSI
jgi:17beta-estradiol 17-dehydrogenase / very-long-chain 3-oxoacyl-CoA reductase